MAQVSQQPQQPQPSIPSLMPPRGTVADSAAPASPPAPSTDPVAALAHNARPVGVPSFETASAPDHNTLLGLYMAANADAPARMTAAFLYNPFAHGYRAPDERFQKPGLGYRCTSPTERWRELMAAVVRPGSGRSIVRPVQAFGHELSIASISQSAAVAAARQ